MKSLNDIGNLRPNRMNEYSHEAVKDSKAY